MSEDSDYSKIEEIKDDIMESILSCDNSQHDSVAQNPSDHTAIDFDSYTKSKLDPQQYVYKRMAIRERAMANFSK